MAKIRHFAEGARLEEWFLDELQELASDYCSSNFVLSQVSGTQIRVVAGAGNAQVGIAIVAPDGTTLGWRWNAADITAAVPGGLSSGRHDIYVIASANSFAINGSPPPHELDNTTHTFGLKLVQGGTTPSGTGSEAYYRKVGTFSWDGAKITGFTQTVGRRFPPVVQAAQANPPLGPQDGEVFYFKGGTGLEPLALVYNAALGQWVSDVVASARLDSLTPATNTSYTDLPGSSIIIPNYKDFYDAGMSLQLQLVASIVSGESNRTVYLAPHLFHADAEDSAFVNFVVATDANGVSHGIAGPSSDRVKVKDWFTPAGLLAPKKHLMLVPAYKTSGGAVSTWQVPYAVIRARLVASG